LSTITYTTEQEEALVDPKARKVQTMTMMMLLIIFVVVMMFGAWSSAYIVSMSSGFWASFSFPSAFSISTGIIILCSIGIYGALYFAKKNNQKALVILIVVTFILSIAFGLSQFNGWNQMIAQGNYMQSGLMDLTGVHGEDHVFYYKGEKLLDVDGQFFMPEDTKRDYALNDELAAARNTSSSYFYVLTGMHLVHVVLGMGLLIFVLVRALKGRYNNEYSLGLKLTGMYWHFMGGLWIYILLFLHFIH